MSDQTPESPKSEPASAPKPNLSFSIPAGYEGIILAIFIGLLAFAVGYHMDRKPVAPVYPVPTSVAPKVEPDSPCKGGKCRPLYPRCPYPCPNTGNLPK